MVSDAPPERSSNTQIDQIVEVVVSITALVWYVSEIN